MLKLDILLDEAILLLNLFDVLPNLWSCGIIPRPWFWSPVELVYHARNVASTARIPVLIPMIPSAMYTVERLDRPCAAHIFILLIADNLNVL